MASPGIQVERVVHASSTPDEAWEVLSQVYMRVRPRTRSPQASVSVDTAVVPGLAVDRGRASAARCRFDPSPGQLVLLAVLDGRMSLDAGRGGSVEAGPGECLLYPPDRSADMRWDELALLPVRLSQQEVAALAAVQTGLPEEAFRFLSSRPRSPELGQLWVRTTGLLRDQLLLSSAESISPLVHRALVTVAAAAALEVFPSTAMTRGYTAAAGDVRPAAVRRAVAYVDAHLSLPITVADAATAAGTTPHALRAAFRQHLGTTFGAHLRRARCDAARHDLGRAEEVDDATLHTVATTWGFTGAADLRGALEADRPGR